MKVQTIDIKNFLALKQVILNLQAPINIIAGANEAGKSSIRDAIQWCLTGQARGLKTHEQQAYLIREGAKAAEVTITLADGQAIVRKKTPKTPASIIGPVPDDQIMASIICDPLTFLSLPDDKRREILFQLIPGLNPDPGKIKEIFIGQMLKAHGSVYECPDPEGFHNLALMAASQGFKAAETEAITRRRIAKRARDEAKVEDPEARAIIGDREFVLPDIKQADVEAGLSALRVERDKLLQKRGKVEAQTDKVPEMEQELGALVSNPVEPPDPSEIDEWQSALEINRPILDDLQKQVDGLASGKAPRFYPGNCPAFSEHLEVPCPSNGQVAIKGMEAPDPAKVKKLKDDMQDQQQQVVRLETGLKEAQAKQTAYADYTKKRQELADKIAKFKEHREQTTATAHLDEEIALLDARMKVGYDLLDAVREFWRQKEAAEAAQAKITEAEKEIVLYDSLAKALAPDGIPSQLIAEALEPFNKRLYMASSYLFPEYEDCPLVLTQDLEVYRQSPYACLSKSARYRAGICFQYVLATLAGARLLMIDEADILDPVNRAQLIDFLLAVRQDFDTILVFATSNEAQPSQVPEIQVWWLEEGKIAPVIPELDEQAAG